MKTNSLHTNLLGKIADIFPPFVADLSFLLLSKSLAHPNLSPFKPFTISIKESEAIAYLKQLENPPQKSNFNQIPLGKYAEQLLVFYFTFSSQYKLLDHGVQLFEENQTVGEIDFLLYSEMTKEYIHLEFALKYYLKVREKNEYYFLGPNKKDTFNQKVSKLMHHQLPLSSRYRNCLPNDFNQLPFQAKYSLKGCLFYPFSEWSIKMANWSKGWWINQDQLHQVITNEHLYKLVSQKKDWINPFSYTSILDKRTCELFLKKHFSLTKKEIMLIRFNKNKSVVDRGFVMANNWPA